MADTSFATQDSLNTSTNKPKPFRILKWLYLFQIIPTMPFPWVIGVIIFILLSKGDKSAAKKGLIVAAVSLIINGIIFVWVFLVFFGIVEGDLGWAPLLSLFLIPMFIANLAGYYYLYRGYKQLT